MTEFKDGFVGHPESAPTQPRAKSLNRAMQPFEPHKLPLTDLDWRQLLPLVGQANSALAYYDGLLAGIPNPAVMLSPLTTQEAVLSSRIEGTQATVDEVLEQEAGLLKEGEKFNDIQEISNYRKALFEALGNSVLHISILPFVAGFAYELLRFAGKFRDNSAVMVLFRPGLWTQLITTQEPRDDQIEVALASLEACMTGERSLSAETTSS